MVLTVCIWFNHLPTEAHLGCFQFLAIMKIADEKLVFLFFFSFLSFVLSLSGFGVKGILAL